VTGKYNYKARVLIFGAGISRNSLSGGLVMLPRDYRINTRDR